MGRELKSWIVAFITPPLLVVGFVFKTLYKLLFSGVDRRLARRDQNRLAKEIREEMPFLFDEYGARIVPNQGVPSPPGFDYAIVTLEIGDLLFRFIRGRGDLDIRVASKNTPKEWHDVLLVIRAMEDPDDMRYTGFIFLRDAAVVLRKKMTLIQEAFSSPRLAETQQHLGNHAKYARTVTKQLETEINRRLS
jgi:hypothetical protein